MPYIIIEKNGNISPGFNTRRDAEYYRAYNHIEGRVMFHNQRAARPQQQQQPIQRTSIPVPPTQRRSLIPNLIGTHNSRSAKIFRPATTRKTMSEMNP